MNIMTLLMLSVLAGASTLATGQSDRRALAETADAAMRSAEGAPASPIRDAALDQAIASYQRLLETGPSSPALEFNLGLAMLERDRVGEAVLHLRRSLMLEPGSVAARDALAAARERVPRLAFRDDKGGVSTASIAVGPSRVAPPMVWALAAVVLHAGAWLTLLVGPQDRRAWVAGSLFGLAVAAGLAAAGPWAVSSLGVTDDAVVTAAGAVPRHGPSESAYEPALDGPLPVGTECRVLRERDGWSEIEVSGERRFWAASRFLSPIDVPNAGEGS